MAPALAERVWRTSTPGAIEGELSALWREIGERGPVARAMMSNLIVFRNADSTRRNGERPDMAFGGIPIDDVAARHPSRVIVIDYGRAAESAGEMTADAGIATFGPPQARYGVEQIAVRCASADASLPSLVRRLVRGDLPTSVWWMEDVSRVAPIPSIVTMGRQLVFDSRRWRDIRRGVLALAPYIDADRNGDRTSRAPARWSQNVDLADVNWRRLMPVRRALTFAARVSETAVWQPRDIRITHRPGDGALAWLLMGWLASRLEWAAGTWPQVEEGQHAEDVLSIAIGGSGTGIRAALTRQRVMVTCGKSAPSVVGGPHEGEADAVAAELHTLSHDICLHDALSALLRSFRAA